MKTRFLRPGFFQNAELAALSLRARLLFAGLWLLADREGKLKDEPLKIRGMLFPYENVDIEKFLSELEGCNFIHRYVNEIGVIHIPTFLEHQNPHPKERFLNLPEPLEETECREIKFNSMKLNENNCRPSKVESNKKKVISTKSTKLVSTTTREDSTPIFNGCQFFRMSEEGYQLAQDWYQKKKLEPAILKHAIFEVDNWLGSDSPTAKRRRKNHSHRLLYETWVLQKAKERARALGELAPQASQKKIKSKATLMLEQLANERGLEND